MNAKGAMRGNEAAAGSTLRLAPLGVPVLIELGWPDLEVRATCADWDTRPAPSARALRIEIACEPAMSGTGACEIAVHGRQASLAGPGVGGTACADRGEAWCTVSADWLAKPASLRAEVLEPLVLFLVARNGRTPLHAASAKIGDLALLLMGPSGSGKSSLALAADRAGWTVMAEDTIYVQQEPEFRVWGCPGPVHLLPGDDPSGPVRVRGGKLKHVFPLRPQHPDALVASCATVCLLERGGALSLERLSPGEALRQIGPLEPGFDLLAAEIAAAHALLVANGAWRLTLSANPVEAIEFLSANLARLGETATC